MNILRIYTFVAALIMHYRFKLLFCSYINKVDVIVIVISFTFTFSWLELLTNSVKLLNINAYNKKVSIKVTVTDLYERVGYLTNCEINSHTVTLTFDVI